MAEYTKEVTLLCDVCESRTFFVTPDGATSYLIECASCGKRSEISAGRGMTLTLVEVPEIEGDTEPSGKPH